MTSPTAPSNAQQQLWEAAMKGDSATIRALAAAGVDLDALNEEGLTAFALATQHSQADTAMTILALREAQYMTKVSVDQRAAVAVEQTRKSA